MGAKLLLLPPFTSKQKPLLDEVKEKIKYALHIEYAYRKTLLIPNGGTNGVVSALKNIYVESGDLIYFFANHSDCYLMIYGSVS